MTGTTGTGHHAAGARDARPHPSIGVRVLEVPPIPATAVRDCLTRLPARHDADWVEGRLLWLPRLGITVLPHEPVTGGWVCTLVGVDGGAPGRVPSGVFVVADLEIRTAFGTRSPWQPIADLTGAEFLDAWRIRYAAHGSSVMLGEALLTATDLDTLTVDTTAPTLRARSGARTQRGFAQACRNLAEAGLLLALFEDTPDPGGVHDEAGQRRQYGLALPAAARPASWRPR